MNRSYQLLLASTISLSTMAAVPKFIESIKSPKRIYKYAGSAQSEIISNQAKKYKTSSKINSKKDFQRRLPQIIDGFKVYGSEVVFHYSDGKLIETTGRQTTIKSFDKNIQLSKSEAIKLVSSNFSQDYSYSGELLLYPLEEKAKLVYQVHSYNTSSSYSIFVDAITGEIVDAMNEIQDGKGHGVGQHGPQDGLQISSNEKGQYVLKADNNSVNTYSFNNFDCGDSAICYFLLPGTTITSENKQFENKSAIDAHFYAQKVHDLLKNDFKRDSYDNKGSAIVSTVNFGVDYNNAFWHPMLRQMVYGDGDGIYMSSLTGAIDVVAHEITHAVTNTSSKLEYRGEAGALNESFSDIMGAFAEYSIQPHKFDFKVGEDIFTPHKEGDAMRYMDNPTKDKEVLKGLPPEQYEKYKHYHSRDFYPERYTGDQDNGGVHLNSGISNLAFSLLVKGGKHPRLEKSLHLRGIGMEKAIQIYYQAFTQRLVSTSTFSDAKIETIAVARKLYGLKAAKSVRRSWDIVGVK